MAAYKKGRIAHPLVFTLRMRGILTGEVMYKRYVWFASAAAWDDSAFIEFMRRVLNTPEEK